MAVQVQNDYRLGTDPLTPNQIRAALTGDLEGFRYFFENCCQIQDKVTRELVHPKMNKGQEMIAKTILHHVAKETRTDYHKEVVICGPRQFGKSTILMAIANYMAAYVPGMERLSIIHSLQTGGAASKFYSQKVAPLVAGCLKGDAEVMTRHGWVKFDDYNGEEILIGDGDKSWFEKPKEVVHYDNDEGLIEYSKKNGYYHLSTKGHRMVYKHNGEVRIREAWQGLPADSSVNELVVTTKLYGKGIRLSDNMLRLAVAIQADGYYDKDCDGISFQFAKLRKVERLENILNDLGLRYSKHRINCGKNEGQYKIRVLAGHGIPNYKNLPFEWIYQSNKHQKEVLIEEIKKWDGYESPSGFSEYYTTNEYQATWVNTLARMSGIFSSLIKREINRGNSHDIYRVTFPGKRGVMTTQGLKRIEVPYSGKVHCVSVSSTMFWTRMNGCISLTGNTHPDIFANIKKDTLGTSTQLFYKDVKGIPRDSIYEILSASSNSVRSGTVTVWLADEPSEYRNPEMTEDAISGAIGDYGFSFTAYIGTFSDRVSDYFLSKILKALESPDEMELVFIPWFLVYGKPEDAGGFSPDQYTDYDKEVSIPEMIKHGFSEDEILYKLAWYHRRELRTSKMRYEFPSSVQDLVNLSSDSHVFDKEGLDKQVNNLLPGAPYRLITDNATVKVEAQKVSDDSPFRIFRAPISGHRYAIGVDPITAQNDSTDNFAMSVFDTANNEQVAVFRGRNMPMEDYADYAVGMAKIYNRAMIIPETNVAEGFIAYVNEGHKYYNWYYQNNLSRKKRVPGVRTSVSNREGMIDTLALLLQNGNIIIHDEVTLEEMRNFVKKTKKRADGGVSIRMEAKGNTHDDTLFSCLIYCATLNQQQITGKKNIGWTIL